MYARAWKDIYVEKPLAHTPEEGRRIVEEGMGGEVHPPVPGRQFLDQ